MQCSVGAFRSISLQARLLLGTVLVLLVVMTAVLFVVEHRQRAAIIEEVERRGEVTVRNLGAISSGALLLYNFTALEQNVSRIAREAKLVYAIILDAEGTIAAHSRHPELVGITSEGADEFVAKADSLLVREIVRSDTREAVYDFVVPITIGTQRWGTARIGLSKRQMEAQIRQTRRELSVLTLLTLVLGGSGAAFVARRIARPVRKLAEAAAAIARGDLNQQIVPSSSDEIGQLAVAFNQMTRELQQQRTALQAAHADLRRHFERLADLKSYNDSILNSLTSGIITLDLEGRVVTMNPACELLTGLFAAEVSGRYCSEVFSHSAEIVDVLIDNLVNDGPRETTSLTLRKRNGTLVSIELSTAPLAGADGKQLGVVCVFRDVTIVHELEAQLRRSDRLAALGTLAAGLAHEIKNPLTSVQTFTRRVFRQSNDERFRQTFETVVPRELERINTIVDDLLELARPRRMSLKSVQLTTLLERALDLYANHIETKQFSVVREYVDALLVIQADAEYLYQALLNIIANALEAMGPGGRLTLRVGWAEESVQRSVKVEIEDTGPGIPHSDADNVFTPFFTTKDSGTGLGLALAHKTIEDHGGQIKFRSTPGVGTRFILILPTGLSRSHKVLRDLSASNGLAAVRGDADKPDGKR
jgi:PAS domain S-box-containing protein